jgi:hypothetical protein
MAGRPRARTKIVPLQDVLDNQAIHTEKWTLYGVLVPSQPVFAFIHQG